MPWVNGAIATPLLDIHQIEGELQDVPTKVRGDRGVPKRCLYKVKRRVQSACVVIESLLEV